MAPINLDLTRTFPAPAAAVYSAWTDPQLLMRWWGPDGFTCPLAELDVRVGGTSFVCMRAPAEWGGLALFNTWTYGVVDPARRLEFVLRFADEERRVISPQSLGLPAGIPPEVPHVLTFADVDRSRSTLSITEAGYTSMEALHASRRGLEQTLDKLAQVLRP